MGSLPTVGPPGQLCGCEVEGTGPRREASGEEEEEGAGRVGGKQEETGRGLGSGDFWVFVSELALGPPRCISMTNPSVLVVFLLGWYHLASILVTKVTCDLLL